MELKIEKENDEIFGILEAIINPLKKYFKTETDISRLRFGTGS